MADGSDKCSMFGHFYAVLDTYKDSGDDEFLLSLNKFFLLFRRLIAEGKLSTAILTKTEEQTKLISAKAITLYDWMRVAALAEGREFFAEILKLKKAFDYHTYGAFVEEYQKIIKVSTFSKNSGMLTKALSKALIADCKRTDCNQDPIPLDVWLILGSSQYTNAFQLFDVTSPRPCVLDQQETLVVGQSKLLKVRPYSLYAEDYIQNRGAEAKVVRKWINELKNIEKRRRADERKTRGESEGSVFERGLSFMSQFTAGNDSQPNDGNVKDMVEGTNTRRGLTETGGTISHPGIGTTPTNKPSVNNGKASAHQPVAEGNQFEQRGFTQPEPNSDNKTGEKDSGKKGFLKGLFGRK